MRAKQRPLEYTSSLNSALNVSYEGAAHASMVASPVPHVGTLCLAVLGVTGRAKVSYPHVNERVTISSHYDCAMCIVFPLAPFNSLFVWGVNPGFCSLPYRLPTDLGSSGGESPRFNGSSAGDLSRRSPAREAEGIDNDKDGIATGRVDARYALIHPKQTSLKERLQVDDEDFVAFVEKLLSVDPTRRYESCECGSMSAKIVATRHELHVYITGDRTGMRRAE